MLTAKQKSGYLPSLDGWRAIAITGVVMVHDQPWHFWGFSNTAIRDLGGYGVELFFAISGLLICWRILEEESLAGSFHLRSFYLRRLFRIQPAAIVYLFCIAALILFGAIHERWHFWLGALLLYQNFTWRSFEYTRMLQQGWFTGHFWTLSVEEHFYILLSMFLYFCKRHRSLIIFVFLVALFFGQRWAQKHGYWSSNYSDRRTYWVIQLLVFPSFMALVLRSTAAHERALRWLRPWIVFSITGLLLVLHQVHLKGSLAFSHMELLSKDTFVLFYCFTFWVASTMLHPRSWTTRLLEARPLRYIGRLSYSIYLWHLIFLSTATVYPAVTWSPLVALGHRPWRYLGILGSAMLSYHLLEKPMMRLGHRLAPPASPGHSDLQIQRAFAEGHQRLDTEL